MNNKRKIMIALGILAAMMMLAVPLVTVAFTDDSSAAEITGLTSIANGETASKTSTTAGYYVAATGATIYLANDSSTTDPVKLYVPNGFSVTIAAYDGGYGCVHIWACDTAAATVNVESATEKDGGFEVDSTTAVTVSSSYSNNVGTITWTAVSDGGDNINVLGKLNVTGTYASSLTLYQSSAEITATNFSGTVKCGTTQITVNGFSGKLSYSDTDKIAISGTITGTVTGISANVIYSGITYGIMFVHDTVMTCYAAGTDVGTITLATGDKFAITNGSAVVKHIVSTTLDNEVTFDDFVAASTNYVEITATSDTVTTMKSTAFSSSGCTGGSITVDKGKFTLVDGTHAYSPISGSCGCTFNLATIGTKDGWTYVASKLSEMQSLIDSSNCVLAIMGEPAVLTDTLDLTSTLGTIPVSLYVKKATMTSLTIVNATFTHTMAFDNVSAKIWNVHIEKPIIDSMDGPNVSGTKGTLVGTVTLKAGAYNVPKDGLIIGYYVSASSESNVTGSLVIDNGATFDITPIQVSDARSTAGPVIVSANGMITNNGIVTIGTTMLSDLTKVEGKVTVGTDNKITADNGSKITWGTKSLAATDGTFEFALATKSLTIKTGTVTMDKADIYTGQTVTVDNGATFIITGAMAIQTGATITNGGTVKVGTYTLTDMTEIKGPMTYDGTSTISASSGSKITWGSGRTLEADSGAAFTVALATMSPTVTAGTVTLTGSDIFPGQTVTVNTGATLAISGTVKIWEGATLVNNGTVTSAATLTNDGTIENNGTFTNTGTLKFGTETLGVKSVVGAVSLEGDGSIVAGAGSVITFNNDKTIEAKASSAWTADWNTTNSAYDIVITQGTVDMTAPVWSAWTLTVNNGTTLNVPAAGITVEGSVVNNGNIIAVGIMTVTGTLTNNNVVDVQGTLTDSYAINQSSQMIVNTNGTINVSSTGTLKVGCNTDANVNIDGKIIVATGGQFMNKTTGENILIGNASSTNPLIKLTAGNVEIDAASVGGAVTYTLKEDSVATFKQSNAGGFAFKAGDLINVDGALTVEEITIPAGARMAVTGTLLTPASSTTASIVLIDSGAIVIEPTGVVNVAKIDFQGATKNSKVITIKQGGKITALLDGSDSGKTSILQVTNISAGAGGISVTKGSVYINGAIATPDAEGTITIPATAPGSVVYVSGTVEEGVKVVVPAGTSVVVPKETTLTFEKDSALEYEAGATIAFEDATAAIVYEKGSTVNDVVVEVEKKENSEGTVTAVKIYLVSQDSRKLLVSIDFVEILPGKTYGDALKDVTVTPAKKSVTFDGWYNLAFNEKIRSTDAVGNNDVTLTACFSEEKVVPIIPEKTTPTTADDGKVDYALPAAFILLVVSIFALGYVIIKKRN